MQRRCGSPAQGDAICATTVQKIPERTLRNIMEIIEARSSEVIQKWIGFFGSADFYC